MRDETYLYEDTILNAVNELMEQEWQYNDAEEVIRILQNSGLVIREKNPRKEDIVRGISPRVVSSPTLTGGISTSRPVRGPLYYEYTPATVNGSAGGLNYANNYGFTHPIDEENDND